jgi:hypothetical protein
MVPISMEVMAGMSIAEPRITRTRRFFAPKSGAEWFEVQADSLTEAQILADRMAGEPCQFLSALWSSWAPDDSSPPIAGVTRRRLVR